MLVGSCDLARQVWRRLKESVLSGKGGRIQCFLYQSLTGLVARNKQIFVTSDLSARAFWLMYHPEAGVLPCEGWRMTGPLRFSEGEISELQTRWLMDAAAGDARLNLEEVCLSACSIPPAVKRRIAIHVHAFFPDVLPRILTALDRSAILFDLFISAPEGVTLPSRLSQRPRCLVRTCPNRGRDLAPLVCTFGKELLCYDYVAHFHTKKSAHVVGKKDWLGHLLDQLLGSQDDVERILGLLESGYGFVSPSDYLEVPEDPTGWMRNRDDAERILSRSSLTLDLRRDYTPIRFPQGSMFWARTDFLESFFELPLTYDDFPEEPIGVDGSPAHALERLFFLWGQETSLKVACLKDNAKEA
ncbi:MAG: rhamnan synthesis F family protein [Kiritimatiellae bacterium]|nr:rhamnan synthesis F family protein [Kiritimatiellia bacterium]